MNEKKLVPRRRFEKFQNADAWEQRELGDVTDIFDGTHQTPKYTASGVRFVSVENISNLETKKYISQEAYEKEYSNKQAEKGDVLMTRIGDIGTAKVIETDQPLAYYVTLALLKPKTVDSDFLSWALASPGVQSDIWKRTLHIAFPKKINLGEINQLKLAFPSNTEQIQIGNFFKHLDQMISLEQRKLEKTKALKSAYLAEMFPAEGERVPKRRFVGFTEEWEERKLGNHTKIITKGTTPKDQNVSGDVNFIKVENITDRKILPVSKITNYEHENYLKRSRLKENDILFSIAGTLGRTAVIDTTVLPANTNQALAIIRGYDFNTEFLITLLGGPVVVKYIKQNPTVGAQPNLSLAQIEKLEILTPSKEEQRLIGNFFKKLDESITNQQQKLNKLKAMKQAYLEEMFV